MNWKPFGKNLKDLTDQELRELYHVAKHYPYNDKRAEKQWILLMDEIQKRGTMK